MRICCCYTADGDGGDGPERLRRGVRERVGGRRGGLPHLPRGGPRAHPGGRGGRGVRLHADGGGGGAQSGHWQRPRLRPCAACARTVQATPLLAGKRKPFPKLAAPLPPQIALVVFGLMLASAADSSEMLSKVRQCTKNVRAPQRCLLAAYAEPAAPRQRRGRLLCRHSSVAARHSPCPALPARRPSPRPCVRSHTLRVAAPSRRPSTCAAALLSFQPSYTSRWTLFLTLPFRAADQRAVKASAI